MSKEMRTINKKQNLDSHHCRFALFSAKKRYMGSYPDFRSAKEMADKIVGTYVVPDPNTNGVWYLCNSGFTEFIIREEMCNENEKED